MKDDKDTETILQKLERFRKEGSAFAKSFDAEKDEQERFYKGEHWLQKDPENRPKNHIFQIVEAEIPLLMDPMPSTDIVAHDDEKFGEQALVLKAAMAHVYQEQSITLKDVQAIRSSLKTGSGYQYVDFDSDGEHGEGSVTVKNLHRKQVIKDPSADTLDQCRYIIVDVPLSNDDLKRRYPKTAKEAISQPLKDLYLFNGTKGAREHYDTGFGDSKTISRYSSKDITFVTENWIKDYSMEEIPDEETQIQLTEESAQLMEGINPDISKWEDHPVHIDGHRDMIYIVVAQAFQVDPAMLTEADIEAAKQDPNIALIIQIIEDHIQMHEMYINSMDEDERGMRPKYPNNLRLIVTTGQTIHFDGPADVDDGLVPLVEFELYKDDGPAEGEIKHLIPLQKTINELDAKELRGLKRATNSGWIVDEQADVDDDTLTDEEGIVVTKKMGTEVTRIPPGAVSTQLAERSNREYGAMQRISGTGETVFGESPKGDPSGVMYRRMQMQALGRIRLKSRMVEVAVLRRDKLILSRVMKYWSTERKLRTDDASGKIRFVKFDPRMMENFTYVLMLSPGSTSGMDSETVNDTYKEMFTQQQIDLRTYVMMTNLPKKQDLLQILDQQKEEQDQSAQQIQQLTEQNTQLQKDSLRMKANLAPETLTPEEIKALEAYSAQDAQAQMVQDPMAVGSDQAQGEAAQ